MKISIVSPVYKAADILPKLVEKIQEVMQKIGVDYEIILVDDRSPDYSWEVMLAISKQYKEVKSVRLSKNFGQHPAIMAGLSLVTGEWTVVMDCDLQDQPKEIEKLYNKAIEGYDIVLARRYKRQDSFFKRMSSKAFSLVYGYFTDTKFDNSISNFGIYHKKVIDSVNSMNDYIKSFPLFVKWVGFNSVSIDVEHANRDSGESSYSLSKLLSLAFNTIISFSDKPLRLFVKFGLVLSFLSFMYGIRLILQFFHGEITVLGYSSIMVSIWFLSGILITIIGVTGIYIGKIFEQTKGRSSFIIDSIIHT